eukprot:CAMPEP_0179062206 /NCGR_PEP_ID=MMETSP0796-20121207/26812_1 /TAXON_ID=73915 /ORGANISM="Pyrodinium bahamense, Strain pbaha01" /LENGTH=65 /DNA_ID=CAMNT_0020759113 /DNA_START=407 /DNA_END=604 /DNA_ORIENTATION=+
MRCAAQEFANPNTEKGSPRGGTEHKPTLNASSLYGNILTCLRILAMFRCTSEIDADPRTRNASAM